MKDIPPRDVAAMRPVVRAMVASMLRRGLPPGIDKDDLEQEAMVAVLHAAERWDPKAGASWSTYAYRRAEGAIKDELRRIGGRTEAQREARQVTSLEAPVAGMDEGESTVGDTLVAPGRGPHEHPDPALAGALEKAIRGLSFDEQTAIQLRLVEGLSQRVIGKAMGVSESRVSQYLASARRKLELHVELHEMMGS